MKAVNKEWEDYVRESILAHSEFRIEKVHNLKSLKTLEYKNYSKILRFIENGDIVSIDQFLPIDKAASQYLEIMKFEDQENREYYVTVYDSDSLWQDPQVINIIKKDK
jgi:hypothetical protein